MPKKPVNPGKTMKFFQEVTCEDMQRAQQLFPKNAKKIIKNRKSEKMAWRRIGLTG